MAKVVHDIKAKLSAATHSAADSNPAPQQNGEQGQTFSILPHPAKSNDPADLQKPAEETGGLRSEQGAFGAFKHTPGPVIPDQSMLNNIPPPKSREELRAEQAQLNSQD